MSIAPPKSAAQRSEGRRRTKARPGKRLAPPPGTMKRQRSTGPSEAPQGAPKPVGQRPVPRSMAGIPKSLQALHGQMEQWMAEAFTKMGAPELIGEIPWHWNPKMKSTMGRAHMSHGLSGYKPKKMDFAPRLFKRATTHEQRQTVYHECAHIVDYHKGTYDPNRPHGESWKRYMRKAGVAAKRCHEVRPVGRVEVWCSCKTHYVTKKKRGKIRSGRTHRCQRCGSKITAVKPPNR